MPTHPIIAEDIRGMLLRNHAVIIASLALAFAASLAATGAPLPESPILRFTRPAREIIVQRDSSQPTKTLDDTRLLQAALDNTDCVISLPAGLYVVSQPLKVHSRTWVDADPDAVIRLADGAGRDAASFLLTNADTENGNHDIVIEGGVWDGNNMANPRKREYHGRSYGGVAVNFVNVCGLTLRAMTIRNPESFSIRLGEVDDFLIEGIRFDQSAPRPNQDGIHVGGLCKRGIVRNLRVISASGTHDDMVALNADDDVERPFNVGLKCGDISDILVEDLESQDAYTFVRLLSHRHAISNIVIRGIRGGFRTNAINADRWRFPAGHGNLWGISIENVIVRKTGPKPDPCVLIQSACTDVSLRGIRREASDAAHCPMLVLDNGRPNILRGVTETTSLPSSKSGTQPAENIVDGAFTIPTGGIARLSIESGKKVSSSP
jgi:hypothetical protein